jgi:hypothetical protein
MGNPSETRQLRESESILHEYRRHARPLIVDGLVFLTTLGILLVGFAGLKILAAAGYNKGYVEFLENCHFLGYAIVTVLFVFDMVMFVKVFARVRGAKHEN